MPQDNVTILVIDDSSTVRKIIVDFLSKAGFAVLEADSIESAMGNHSQADVSLVISDLVMPGVGGVAGISILKERWPLVGVIAMSAGSAQISSASLLNIARSAGAHKMIAKPFTNEQLLELVRELISNGFGTTKRRRKVIVVEDSATLRKMFGKVLGENGYDCICLESAEQAIASPDILGIDCIITDIFMPGKGGIRGIQEIKASWPQVPIIAMSGGVKNSVGANEALMAAKKCGADATLQKPFTPQVILNVLDRLVKGEPVDATT